MGGFLRGCSDGDVNTVCVIPERWSAAAAVGPPRADAGSTRDQPGRMKRPILKGLPLAAPTPASPGSLGPAETTYLLWQLVARSSRASRCLCFQSSSCRMFAFPVDPKITSPVISCSAITHRLGARPSGQFRGHARWGGGGRLLCFGAPAWFRGICRLALFLPGGDAGLGQTAVLV